MRSGAKHVQIRMQLLQVCRAPQCSEEDGQRDPSGGVPRRGAKGTRVITHISPLNRQAMERHHKPEGEEGTDEPRKRRWAQIVQCRSHLQTFAI